MTSLFESIVDVLVGRFDVDREKVNLEASFEDIHLDSLSQIELSTELKKKLSIDIDDDDVADVATIGELVSVVEGKLVARDAGL